MHLYYLRKDYILKMIKKIIVTTLFTAIFTTGSLLDVQAHAPSYRQETPSTGGQDVQQIEILTITNNTGQERDVQVFSTLPDYGREEKSKKMRPYTTLTVKSDNPLQGVMVWVSDPLPGQPNRSCRYETSVGSTILASTVINNPSFVATGD